MKRVDQIYCVALDYTDEFFGNECNQIIETQNGEDYAKLVNDVQQKMIIDDKITADDICGIDFMEIREAVIKGVNDAIYMRQVLLNNDYK